ncbi:hypothetical protein [Hymenobacter baengnokdamensis]|uniref:hypothetical protein n=1 Tax=Hymenobacter baengnokdamensis TaxID=2615203 RepID=UPI0012459620|nr:hypothetical protein [Hymenobacter baengnokdamensis]
MNKLLILAILLGLPDALLAQQLPFDLTLTEPDQELDDFTYQFVGIHKMSPQLRGVRGADNTVYWVSANSQQLTAYQQGKQLWQVAIGQTFQQTMRGAIVTKLIFCSTVVFVSVGSHGQAEIDRKTGAIISAGTD